MWIGHLLSLVKKYNSYIRASTSEIPHRKVGYRYFNEKLLFHKNLLETSAIRGFQVKYAEPYFLYGEEYFTPDNKEVCRLERFFTELHWQPLWLAPVSSPEEWHFRQSDSLPNWQFF